MTALFFVDSNVLIYRYDAAAPAKQSRANLWMDYLWHSRRGRLSIQVLQEFYVNVTQKVKPGLSRYRSVQGRGRLRRDPHPLAPSPTRTPTLPGEGEPPNLCFRSLGGGAPLPGGRECGWERGWG
jgi:hypothetical protein